MPNIVWVIGSGFSRPLGGPTLHDLFRPEREEDLRARYSNNKFVADPIAAKAIANVLGQAALATRRLYNLGIRWAHGSMSGAVAGQHLWDDPEQFLDILETAALRAQKNHQSVSAERLVQIAHSVTQAPWNLDVVALRNAARRMLAVECSTFLLEADPESERWEPYRRWCGLVRGADARFSHTIVTFNYDLVLETMGMRDWVRLPAQASGGGPSILKLHGSVDWRRKGDSFEVVTDDALFPATCADGELALAPPGPAKAAISKEFEPLWKAAEDRLRQASAVVFMGYRFPQTDATARRRLLDALPRAYAIAHIVLGPDERHADVARLRGLLAFRVQPAGVRVHPMWAEDFLSVFEQTLFPG